MFTSVQAVHSTQNYTISLLSLTGGAESMACHMPRSAESLSNLATSYLAPFPCSTEHM